MTTRRLLLIPFMVVALATLAQAQSSPSTRLRGTVAALDGRELTLAVREGGTARIILAEDWSALEVARIDPAKIPVGAFVGVGAARLADGSLKAVQVVVFPESMRGTGEGHRAWDVVPEGTMTNAPVAATVTGASGPSLTLATGGKTYDVVIPADARVVILEEGAREVIKPGTPVIVTARPGADGVLAVSRVQTGKGGTEPPL